MTTFVDTHTHLNFPDFQHDLSSVVERARSAGVRFLVNIGTDLESSKQVISLAEQHASMYAAIGFHPHDVGAVTEEALNQMAELAKHPKVVAIGEVGLDYYKNRSPIAVQHDVVIRCFKLAQEVDLPLALHIRDAYSDMTQLLKEHFTPPIRAVAHCFSGTQEMMEKLLDLGLFISFAGHITYKKNDALREVVKRCPVERMMLETDAPFLAPQGFRGGRNEPAYAVETAKLIAGLKGMTLEDVARATTRNAGELYGVDFLTD